MRNRRLNRCGLPAPRPGAKPGGTLRRARRQHRKPRRDGVPATFHRKPRLNAALPAQRKVYKRRGQRHDDREKQDQKKNVEFEDHISAPGLTIVSSPARPGGKNTLQENASLPRITALYSSVNHCTSTRR